MKNALSMAAGVAILALAQHTFAQQPTAPPASPAQQAAPTPAEIDAQFAKLQQLMTQMNTQMADLQKAQDPAERQELMREHWATMQSAMALMQDALGAGGHMMMGGGPMMWQDYSKLSPEQLKQRQYMMDRWMPMQQMMMSHMMQQQSMMMPRMMQTPPPAVPKAP